MTDGFIALHRSLREHPYWRDPERLRAWIDVLFMAAWKPHRRMVGARQVEIQRGEFVASERYLATRWCWSRGKVRRFLATAVDAREIERVSTMNVVCSRNGTTDGTIYRVVNYDTYQKARPTNRPTDGTSNGPPADQIEERKEIYLSTPPISPPSDPTAAAVGEFCTRTGATWKLKAGIDEWAAEIRREPKYAGLDHAYQVRRCMEWHEGKSKRPTAPDRAIRNWLERAANNGRHHDRRATGQDGGPTERRAAASGRRAGFEIE